VGDNVIIVIATFGIAVPSFVICTLMMYTFGVRLKWLPTLGLKTWKNYIMPVTALAFYPTAYITRLMRSSMLEVLRQDYIKAVRAKGAPERVTIFRHAFKNSSIPIVTLIGMQIGGLMGGTVVIEQIFSIPGLGQFTLTGISQRDYPVVQGCVLFIAFLYVIINLLVDILYTYIDPRISYS
jgi:oligopeptide transport system permease protein